MALKGGGQGNLCIMDTLYLDPESWDIVADANGDWAIASSPYAVAQDVASECLLWYGEARYDNTKGIPYEPSIMGELPPPAKLISWFRTAAEGVPEVQAATVLLNFNNRHLTGEIQVTLESGSDFTLTI